MDALAGVARQLAEEAIAAAQAGGGNAAKIAEANAALADGDAKRGAGEFKDAIRKYRVALAKAESA